MSRGQTISFSFPPFAGWVKRIILTCTGIYLFQVVMGRFAPSVVFEMREWLALIPVDVMHGKVWQLVTYSLLHAGLGHVFFNMLTLWFIGAYLERDWGPRRFIECYTFCVVGAALVTIAVSYTHFLGMDPRTGTVGASGGIFGLLMAFVPSRGISYAASERYFGVRNGYYRWKRRRTARKFEVYMKDHDRKVTFDEHGNYVPPDDDDKTNGGSKSGWVN